MIDGSYGQNLFLVPRIDQDAVCFGAKEGTSFVAAAISRLKRAESCKCLLLPRCSARSTVRSLGLAGTVGLKFLPISFYRLYLKRPSISSFAYSALSITVCTLLMSTKEASEALDACLLATRAFALVMSSFLKMRFFKFVF